MKLGVEEAKDTGKKIYLNLRVGKIAQTSKDELEGFRPVQTENKGGQKFHFFAKLYDGITGYIKEITWHTSEFPDGGTSQGWNVAIDTGGVDYVLYIASNDRPFHRFMSVLGNVDFNEPVRFVGFMGDNKNKVLLLYQDEGDFENNIKPKPVQPKWEEKWLSNQIKQKLREKVELTEQEEKSVARGNDGKIIGIMQYDAMNDSLSESGYPYIVQDAGGKWDFTLWTKFLHAKMEETIIPAISEAAAARESAAISGEDNDSEAQSDPFGNVPDHYVPSADDDDIPF